MPNNLNQAIIQAIEAHSMTPKIDSSQTAKLNQPTSFGQVYHQNHANSFGKQRHSTMNERDKTEIKQEISEQIKTRDTQRRNGGFISYTSSKLSQQQSVNQSRTTT